MKQLLNHPFCLIALVCAAICYVQRCFENKYWITVPLSLIITMIFVLISVGLTAWFFIKIGWYPTN